MGMTGDDDATTAGGRLGPQVMEIMKHLDVDPRQGQREPYGHPLRPGIPVIVATHGVNRSNGLQAFKHFATANIAGMDDVLHPRQRLNRFGSKQSMGIGDQSDSH
jgi:hypothetical protein